MRDLTLIMVGRDLLARRSELVSINMEDLHVAEDGSGSIKIRRSKTDQEGAGAELCASPRTMEAIKRWMGDDIREGALFRRVWKGGAVGDRLSAHAVGKIFRNAVERAGIDPERISGHSCRVGMAQDLVASGCELPALMQAGRWKSAAMPARYTERQAVRRGAVAGFYRV
jgi:integrase